MDEAVKLLGAQFVAVQVSDKVFFQTVLLQFSVCPFLASWDVSVLGWAFSDS